jgi:hypothetical protein
VERRVGERSAVLERAFSDPTKIVERMINLTDAYVGVPGRASYFGDGKENRQFTLWSKKDEREPFLYVYVPRFRVDHDHSLEIVCERASEVESGFMVSMPRWESKVTPEGTLLPA